METDRSTAVVLSGGGAKGAFQAGALEVLHDEGYKFDIISGVSVGSLNGAMLATGQLSTLINIWEKLTPDQVFREQSLFAIARKFLGYKIGIGRPPLSKFNNAPLQRLMQKYLLGKRVTVPFHFGFVKLDTGEYVQAVVQQGEEHEINEMDLERILASTAIPVIFNPVLKNDSVWVDGGLRNISPIREILPFNPDQAIIIPTEPLEEAAEAAMVKDIIDIAFQAITIMLDEIFEEDIDRFLSINRLVKQSQKEGLRLHKSNGDAYKYIEPVIIAPRNSLGSAIDFENSRLNDLIELGRVRAKEVLFGMDKPVT